MSPEIFAKELKQSAPSFEQLSARNLSSEFIDDFIKSYNCILKTHINLKVISNDSMINLILLYDCSKIEIGIVTFVHEIIEMSDYYQIGNVEQDVLIINKISHQVEVLDYTNKNHTIWQCASNSDNFLQAILICAKYSTARIIDPVLVENKKYTKEAVHLCFEKAGGIDYIDFYKMLLGDFD
ncbi:MAG TPA: hypothetical protein VHZ50_05315 [Puia sp.]|jgi:hypothetical protein|nr:hypothetical protein [Puia sp.]